MQSGGAVWKRFRARVRLRVKARVGPLGYCVRPSRVKVRARVRRSLRV